MKKKNSVYYHELGHELVASHFEIEVVRGPLKLPKGKLGVTHIDIKNFEKDSPKKCRILLKVLCAGAVNESLYTQSPAFLYGSDYDDAFQIASYLTQSDDRVVVDKYILKYMKITQKLLKKIGS